MVMYKILANIGKTKCITIKILWTNAIKSMTTAKH